MIDIDCKSSETNKLVTRKLCRSLKCYDIDNAVIKENAYVVQRQIPCLIV